MCVCVRACVRACVCVLLFVCSTHLCAYSIHLCNYYYVCYDSIIIVVMLAGQLDGVAWVEDTVSKLSH